MIYGILIGVILGIGQAHWALWTMRTSPHHIAPNSVIGLFISRLMVVIIVAAGAILCGASPYAVLPGIVAGYWGWIFHILRREAF